MGQPRSVLPAAAILVVLLVVPATVQAHVTPAFETTAAWEEPGEEPQAMAITQDTGPHNHGGGGGGGGSQTQSGPCPHADRTGVRLGPVEVCQSHDVEVGRAVDDAVAYATDPPTDCTAPVCPPGRTTYVSVDAVVTVDAAGGHCYEVHSSNTSRPCPT